MPLDAKELMEQASNLCEADVDRLAAAGHLQELSALRTGRHAYMPPGAEKSLWVWADDAHTSWQWLERRGYVRHEPRSGIRPEMRVYRLTPLGRAVVELRHAAELAVVGLDQARGEAQ